MQRDQALAAIAVLILVVSAFAFLFRLSRYLKFSFITWIGTEATLVRFRRKDWIRLYGKPIDAVDAEYHYEYHGRKYSSKRFSMFDGTFVAPMFSRLFLSCSADLAKASERGSRVIAYVAQENPGLAVLVKQRPAADTFYYFADAAVGLMAGAGLLWFALYF